MKTVALLLVILFVAAALAWNFIPWLREKMRGYSTLVESAIGTLMWIGGVISDAIQQLQAMGILPAWAVKWLPLALVGYFILKRLQTKTPVGEG